MRSAGAAGQVARAAQGLAVGNLDQRVTVRSDDELGQMADAVRSMIVYQHEMADVAHAMATGDLTQDIMPKGALDVLGIAFGQMTTNLRTFVSDLQQQAATLGAQAQLLELASDAIMVSDFVTGKIVYWSHGAEEVYGWTRAEALGKLPHTLLATRFPETGRLSGPTFSAVAAGTVNWFTPDRTACSLSSPAGMPCSATRLARPSPCYRSTPTSASASGPKPNAPIWPRSSNTSGAPWHRSSPV